MTWLLFLDESGHDHKNCPYEVRGGIAVRSTQLWPLMRSVSAMCRLELGREPWEEFSELKGSKLLSRDRWKAATKLPWLLPDERRQLAGLCPQTAPPKPLRQYAAYAQSGFAIVDALLDLLGAHEARVFATALPQGTGKSDYLPTDYLRRDDVFLLQRVAYFLADQEDDGVLVLDQTEATQDRRFLRRLENYFTRTVAGRERTKRINPVPLFVSSAMSLPVQLADICLYCINWGYRLPERGMNAPSREEIARFAPRLRQLVHKSEQEGFVSYSIVPVTRLTGAPENARRR